MFSLHLIFRTEEQTECLKCAAPRPGRSGNSLSVGRVMPQWWEGQIWLLKSVNRVNLLAVTSSCLLRESPLDSIYPANQRQASETEGCGDSKTDTLFVQTFRWTANKAVPEELAYTVQLFVRLGLGHMLAKTKNRCGDDVWMSGEEEESSRRSGIEGGQGGMTVWGFSKKNGPDVKNEFEWKRKIFLLMHGQ